MRKKLIFFCLVLMVFLSGCAVSSENRYNRIKSKHPGWDEQTARQVADRQVAVGMTEEMVLAALGKPSLKEDGHWKYLTYKTDREGYSRVASSYSVYFRDKKVTDTGSHQRGRRGK